MSVNDSEMLPVAAATRGKFHLDGSVRGYPGNSIITHIAVGSPAFAALQDLAMELRRAPGAEAHSFLPASAFHMTLFRGVNDQLRVPGEWPAGVDLDTPLETVTAIFTERLANVVLPDRFVMKPNRLAINASGEIQLNLVGVDAATDLALANARALLTERMRHRRTGDESYRFHVTFSYRTKPTSPDRQALLERHLSERWAAFANRCPEMTMVGPALCTYTDMLVFDPVLLLSEEKR